MPFQWSQTGWQGLMCCFLLKVMTNPMFEGRILRAAALVAAKSGGGGGGGWMKNLKTEMYGMLWLV